jgi:hypothetical protein
MDELQKQGLSAPRRVSALAAVAIGGGTTRYKIPGEVTVPDESATMVLLVSRKVPGRKACSYSQPTAAVPDSSAHPFRVVRFENATTGLLERGPIAVFGEGPIFWGRAAGIAAAQGKATCRSRSTRSIASAASVKVPSKARACSGIEAGQLYIERDSVTKTTYKVVSGSDEISKLHRPATRGFPALGLFKAARSVPRTTWPARRRWCRFRSSRTGAPELGRRRALKPRSNRAIGSSRWQTKP